MMNRYQKIIDYIKREKIYDALTNDYWKKYVDMLENGDLFTFYKFVTSKYGSGQLIDLTNGALRKLINAATPKVVVDVAPLDDDKDEFCNLCPSCKEFIDTKNYYIHGRIYEMKHCPHCGQALAWEED